MGKPRRRRTRHPGLLSLSLPSGMSSSESWRGGSKQVHSMIIARIHGFAVFAEVLAEGLACRIIAEVQEAVAH